MKKFQPNEFIVRFDVDDILRGGADDLSRLLLNTWVRHERRLSDDLAQFMEHVAIMDGRPNDKDSPDVLFCGQKSLLARRLRLDWADHPRIAKSTFHRNYRQFCADAYLEAAVENRPVFDLVHARQVLRAASDKPETYHRLLLPVMTDQGARFTLCYSLDLSMRQYPVDDAQSSRQPQAGIRQNIDLNKPCLPEGLPT